MRLSLPLLFGLMAAMLPVTAPASAEEIERSLEHEPLTMFQMVARSEIVVHARVKDGAGRFAIVDVLSTLKGEAPASQLRIDFRDLNLSPHGQEMVVFRSEEEYVLFLQKKVWRKPKEKKADIVDLMHGRRGRMPLPAEGWGEIVDSVRQLVPLSQSGPGEQVVGLRGLLTTENAILREAVLDEIRRLRSPSQDDLPVLLRLLGDPSPRIRSRVLPLIAFLFASGGMTGMPEPPEQKDALGMVLERARSDSDERVRAESVRALGAWSSPKEILGELKAIAQQDPSQLVRYEAERLLFKIQS